MALDAAATPSPQLQPLPIHQHNRPISQREDNGLAGFEQIRQQLVQAGRAVGAGTAQPAGAPAAEPTVGGRPTPLPGEGNARRTVPALPGAAPVEGIRTIPAIEAAPVAGVAPAAIRPGAPRPPAERAALPPAGPQPLPGVAPASTRAEQEGPVATPERPTAPGVIPATPPQITLERVRELLAQAAGRANLAAPAGRPAAGALPPETPRVTPPAAPRPGAAEAAGPAPRPAPPSLAQLGPEIAQAAARAQLQAAAPRTEGAPGVAPRPRVLIDQVL